MSNWISVEDKLPEEKGTYLVTYRPCIWDNILPGIRVGTDSFIGGTTWSKRKYQKVTHWMPLPEPPKEN